MKNRYLLLMLLLILAACSASQSPPRHSAEQYFQEGERLFEANLFEDAIASWEKVRDSYYSPELNMLAELKIAEAYFSSERYEEAVAAYADFLKQHPNDNRTAEIMYRLGLSHYRQILSADRDQTSTAKAKQVFEELMRRFPESQNAEEVAALIQHCRKRLAEHEIYVGRFYLRIQKYQSSIKRLTNMLAHYPDYSQRDEIYFYLGQAYLRAGEKENAQNTFKKLFEEFPDSEYTDEAQETLAGES